VIHSRRPVLLASTLPAYTLSLTPTGEHPMAACPAGCGRWVLIRRHVMMNHPDTPGATPCPGSGQRIRIDVTFEQWRQRLRDIERTADYRRPSPSRLQPQPPTPTPVCRIRRSAA